MGHGGGLVTKVPGAKYVAEVVVCAVKLPQLFVLVEQFPNPLPGWSDHETDSLTARATVCPGSIVGLTTGDVNCNPAGVPPPLPLLLALFELEQPAASQHSATQTKKR